MDATSALTVYGALVLAGPSKLTPRAHEVAGLIALGLSNREIAQKLFLSERTVEWHVEQVLNELGFSSRSEVAAWVGRTSGSTVKVPGSRVRGNLPAELTPFVGRVRELNALADLVADHRLVTVTGAGGTGKTCLALRLAVDSAKATCISWFSTSTASPSAACFLGA